MTLRGLQIQQQTVGDGAVVTADQVGERGAGHVVCLPPRGQARHRRIPAKASQQTSMLGTDLVIGQRPNAEMPLHELNPAVIGVGGARPAG